MDTPHLPRASSAPLIRWGCIIHQAVSKWREDIHHCPPFKLDGADVAISQRHQYSRAGEGSPADTHPLHYSLAKLTLVKQLAPSHNPHVKQ